jgi:hypothetical protein
MGGSDFHGIDPANERAPGAIPFPRKHVDIFLEHAKKVWEVPLVNKLQSMAELARAEARPQELLIWSEQEDLARRTVEALGLGIEVITDENSAADAGDEGDEAVQPGGHYRTIRIVC